jgi:hypothetical protein
MTIPIQQEEENYTAHIETRVHAGVIVHKIMFLPIYTEDEMSDEFQGLELDPEAGREF